MHHNNTSLDSCQPNDGGGLSDIDEEDMYFDNDYFTFFEEDHDSTYQQELNDAVDFFLQENPSNPLPDVSGTTSSPETSPEEPFISVDQNPSSPMTVFPTQTQVEVSEDRNVQGCLDAQQARICPRVPIYNRLCEILSQKNVSRPLIIQIMKDLQETFRVPFKFSRDEKRKKADLVKALDRYSAELSILLSTPCAQSYIVQAGMKYLSRGKTKAIKPRLIQAFGKFERLIAPT
ncbi:hypothetical protein TRFO_30979 [Tritrichomonas foetus]|uniref:Uncharacterized protein n=1 Tax=Tritrichomonas foetus TaxID=1144522 RepID=A0A1J4JWV6_9EUKA|nr:hypothetical protein TRFO_30979 [Tritrichomonas foetus]|eukprot:OHT02020.1 hypothetical protein TRFO_30979 [Tritrichomonas foetus]